MQPTGVVILRQSLLVDLMIEPPLFNLIIGNYLKIELQTEYYDI